MAVMRAPRGLCKPSLRATPEPGDRRIEAHELALAAAAGFHLVLAFAKALGADDRLMRRADKIHGREFRAGALVAVVVENVDAGIRERRIDARAGAVASGVANLQIDKPDPEGRDRLRPDGAVVVVIGLDQRGGKPGRADAVRAHVHEMLLAVRSVDDRLHRSRILGPEVENMAD